eukprot:3357888-Amphidinium_carterae.1
MNRVRMDLEEKKAVAGANGRVHPYDPSKPWHMVWQEALASCSSWWLEQISEPCLIHSAGPSSSHEQARRTQASRVHNVDGDTYTTNRR